MSVNRSIQTPVAEFLHPYFQQLHDRDDIYGLGQAYIAAQWSDDPSTQVGAWIAGFHGYNRQVDEDPPNLDKNWMRIHAETDALLQCDFPTGATLYAPWACCTGCAADILAAGVERVVVHWERMLLTPEKWELDVICGLRALIRNGVRVNAVSHKFFMTIRVNGQEVEL